jgi:hypothetical protein
MKTVVKAVSWNWAHFFTRMAQLETAGVLPEEDHIPM